MTDERQKLEARKARYLRDPAPVRLGNLASNLSRLKSFAQHLEMADAARKVIRESLHFIEWTASDAAPDVQADLLELQRLLAQWQTNWRDDWTDDDRRMASAQAEEWANRILERSGLLRR